MTSSPTKRSFGRKLRLRRTALLQGLPHLSSNSFPRPTEWTTFPLLDNFPPNELQTMLDAESALTRHEISQYVQKFPYNGVVFLLPPWKEIYATDSERDQDFEESVRVFEGMRKWYSEWGYETLEVPRGKIDERVSFILQCVDIPWKSLLADKLFAASRLQVCRKVQR